MVTPLNGLILIATLLGTCHAINLGTLLNVGPKPEKPQPVATTSKPKPILSPMPTISPDGLTAETELNLTAKQEAALKQVKASSVVKNLVNENMKKDIYLVKFLRANHNLAIATIDAIKAAVDFRDEQGFDNTTVEKDCGDGFQKFESSTKEVDIQGRPILFMQLGKWLLKEVIKNKEVQLYERCGYQLFEDSANKAITSFEKGKKNAQYVFLGDYEGWSFAQGGTDECADIVGRMVFNYGRTWPGFVHRIILINTSKNFQLFLDMVRPFFSADVSERMAVFGSKTEWCPELKKIMPNNSKIKKYCSK